MRSRLALLLARVGVWLVEQGDRLARRPVPVPVPQREDDTRVVAMWSQAAAKQAERPNFFADALLRESAHPVLLTGSRRHEEAE